MSVQRTTRVWVAVPVAMDLFVSKAFVEVSGPVECVARFSMTVDGPDPGPAIAEIERLAERLLEEARRMRAEDAEARLGPEKPGLFG